MYQTCRKSLSSDVWSFHPPTSLQISFTAKNTIHLQVTQIPVAASEGVLLPRATGIPSHLHSDLRLSCCDDILSVPHHPFLQGNISSHFIWFCSVYMVETGPTVTSHPIPLAPWGGAWPNLGQLEYSTSVFTKASDQSGAWPLSWGRGSSLFLLKGLSEEQRRKKHAEVETNLAHSEGSRKTCVAGGEGVSGRTVGGQSENGVKTRSWKQSKEFWFDSKKTEKELQDFSWRKVWSDWHH